MDVRRHEPAITGEWECMECGYIEEGHAGRSRRRPVRIAAPPQGPGVLPVRDDLDEDTGEAEPFEELVEDDESMTRDEGLCRSISITGYFRRTMPLAWLDDCKLAG